MNEVNEEIMFEQMMIKETIIRKKMQGLKLDVPEQIIEDFENNNILKDIKEEVEDNYYIADESDINDIKKIKIKEELSNYIIDIIENYDFPEDFSELEISKTKIKSLQYFNIHVTGLEKQEDKQQQEEREKQEEKIKQQEEKRQEEKRQGKEEINKQWKEKNDKKLKFLNKKDVFEITTKEGIILDDIIEIYGSGKTEREILTLIKKDIKRKEKKEHIKKKKMKERSETEIDEHIHSNWLF